MANYEFVVMRGSSLFITWKKLLHQTLLVPLQRRQLAAMPVDQGIEGGEAVGDFFVVLLSAGSKPDKTRRYPGEFVWPYDYRPPLLRPSEKNLSF